MAIQNAAADRECAKHLADRKRQYAGWTAQYREASSWTTDKLRIRIQQRVTYGRLHIHGAPRRRRFADADED